MSSVNKENLPLESTKQICGILKVNQGEAISSETARRLGSSDDVFSRLWIQKIPGTSQNLSEIAKPVKTLLFPVLRRLFLAADQLEGKSCDICKFTRAVANLQDCAPNRSIPPFVSDGGKERRSFTFFWREILGVCIEKSQGSALRNQGGLHSRKSTHDILTTFSAFVLSSYQFISFLIQQTFPPKKHKSYIILKEIL